MNKSVITTKNQITIGFGMFNLTGSFTIFHEKNMLNKIVTKDDKIDAARIFIPQS